jgi:hypothetical protein
VAAERLEKFIFLPRSLCCSQNSKRNRKKFSAALHILRKAARIISRQNSFKQAASVEFEMHSIAIIARNRVGFDNSASLGVECGGRGEERETHGERQESEARRRVVA